MVTIEGRLNQTEIMGMGWVFWLLAGFCLYTVAVNTWMLLLRIKLVRKVMGLESILRGLRKLRGRE
jgi:hypothetical protein